MISWIRFSIVITLVAVAVLAKDYLVIYPLLGMTPFSLVVVIATSFAMGWIIGGYTAPWVMRDTDKVFGVIWRVDNRG